MANFDRECRSIYIIWMLPQDGNIRDF